MCKKTEKQKICFLQLLKATAFVFWKSLLTRKSAWTNAGFDQTCSSAVWHTRLDDAYHTMNNVGWEVMGKMNITWKAGSMSLGAAGHGFLGFSLCNVPCFVIRHWKKAGTNKCTTPGLIRNDTCIAHTGKILQQKGMTLAEWGHTSQRDDA